MNTRMSSLVQLSMINDSLSLLVRLLILIEMSHAAQFRVACRGWVARNKQTLALDKFKLVKFKLRYANSEFRNNYIDKSL